jgi:lipoprotein-anchoring transpeptidase ErfK/SrfK
MIDDMHFDRRNFLLTSLVVLAGCAADRSTITQYEPGSPAEQARRVVTYNANVSPGTVIVEPSKHALYLVQENGKALMYPVGVGKAGHGFSGRAKIGRKEEWPNWTPTANMIADDPEVKGPLASGLRGGEANPLGARALYLYQDGRDTLYRIHGTNEPSSIDKSVSSGCIRMFNHDVIDLYERVPVGASVIVRA